MQQSTLSFLAAGLFLLASGYPTARGETPSASALLQEMEKTYAGLTSYADESTAIYRNRDESERLSVRFKIWFVRGSGFRVDAESRSPEGGAAAHREVLWTDGAITRSWSTGKPVTSLAKVQLAGSGMFGTYAYHVPTLLEAGFGSRRLHELSEAKVVGEGPADGVDCYHLKGNWQGDSYEVWLGKEDHLVRRIVATYADHILEETHREIFVNEAIPVETFRFAPENEVTPKKAQPK